MAEIRYAAALKRRQSEFLSRASVFRLSYPLSVARPGKAPALIFTESQTWSRREDLHAPSADYDSAALSLSYTGLSTA